MTRGWPRPEPLQWVADVSEFTCVDGKLYLAGILDLHDRGLAGWSMSERNNTDLVVNALVMALARRDRVSTWVMTASPSIAAAS